MYFDKVSKGYGNHSLANNRVFTKGIFIQSTVTQDAILYFIPYKPVGEGYDSVLLTKYATAQKTLKWPVSSDKLINDICNLLNNDLSKY